MELPATAGADVEPLLLSRHRSLIADWMLRHAPEAASLSGKMVSYHMGWTDQAGRDVHARTGKLIRPSLCLWAAQTCGGEIEWALPAAAAVEWFHNFTLVHDDIQDEDRQRHNRETVWSLWGIPQAINAGDTLQALAFRAMARAKSHPDRALRSITSLAEAGLVVIEGQCMDLELEGQVDASLRAYLRMVAAKTGALLGASLEAGSIMAGAPEETSSLFKRAGLLLGAAFQIRDDWLGMYGDPALTGKSSSADANKYKMTFPVVAGLHTMSTLQRRRLRELFRARHDDHESKMRAVLDEVGAERLTRSAAERYAQRAVSTMSRSGIPHSALEEFEEVAYYVATRSR